MLNRGTVEKERAGLGWGHELFCGRHLEMCAGVGMVATTSHARSLDGAGPTATFL